MTGLTGTDRVLLSINKGLTEPNIKEMDIMAQITTTEFAAELGTDGRTARKFLRSITPKDEQPGKGSRWAIDGNKRSLNSMKKRFAEWTAAQTKPAEPEAEVVETEEPTDAEELEPTAEELDELEVEAEA